ncbi:MAG: efflux RND transporter periplasmic adaptor subunit [Candidatus Protochlamydia sp.]|nr:efflux RND transporter periplasmic adaptor subunit [Candidatus Protochlamydia sp.]
MILPPFRRDLKIYAGPHESDGSPTYNLYDPLKGQYYKFSWKEGLVLKFFRAGMEDEELLKKINEQFPVNLAIEDIRNFFSQAAHLGLLTVPVEGERLYEQKVMRKQSMLMWLVHNYLFLKVPLLNPDHFLKKTLPYVKFLGSKPALFMYGLISVSGFLLILLHLEKFWNTITYFFSFEGFIAYALAISIVKLIHEFSHAYVAKRFGIHVPSMGVALLVLLPVLFTDVTEGWRLKSRKERFFISFAGVASELVLAGLATYGWLLTQPGTLQSVFFILASISWTTSLLININPAVRFDGYYIACDLTGIDNLMPRAFQVTRWKMHEWLLGIKSPPPEDNLTTQRTAGFIFYTIYTIIYRFFLYTAIALFVYYEFTKIIGILLFAFEIAIFFVWPVVWEISAMMKLRSQLTWNIRSIIFSTLTVLALLWFVLPLSHALTFPAVLIPDEEQIVYAPLPSQVLAVHIKQGEKVKKGAPLIELKSLSLMNKQTESLIEQERIQNEILIHEIEEFQEKGFAKSQSELKKEKENYNTLQEIVKNLSSRAVINGEVVYIDPELRIGKYLHANYEIAVIAKRDKMFALSFVNENNIENLSLSQPVKLYANNSFETMHGKIISIEKSRSSDLYFPALASLYQGPLAVLPKTQSEGLKIIESFYTILIEIDSPSTNTIGASYTMWTKGPPKSYLIELFKFLYQVLLKESSF